MTVAAVFLIPEPPDALSTADGDPILRRLSQIAWAGGAMPTVVVTAGASDELRSMATELGVVVADPTPDDPRGIAWFVRGMRTAATAVAETSAALLWPFRFAWVDPETVTSLIEAHGATPDSIVRPSFGGRPGFPILIPIAYLERLAALSGQHGEQAVETLAAGGVSIRVIELGDPGIVHDFTTPRADLPGYQGPPEPAGGPPPDWNSVLAAEASDPVL
jgi:CTP:molybdopterin cytidylyltransferase MocA